MITILFPSSYIQHHQVDPDLEDEAKIVAETPGLQLAVFDYEAWFRKKKFKLTLTPEEPIQQALYRGWMMKPDAYKKFYESLSKMHIQLLTTPKEYSTLHLFPNAYPLIKEDTAPTMYFEPGEHVDVNKITKEFQRFMVKDDVKAVKGSKFPSFFDQQITQEEFDTYMNIFYKIRGEYLTGGLCVKEYLDLKTDERGRTNEYRAFFLKGELLSLHPDSGQDFPDNQPPENLLKKYNSLPSPFYSLDLAEKKEGGWIVLETGDGQVSRLSPGQSPELFYVTLAKRLLEQE